MNSDVLLAYRNVEQAMEYYTQVLEQYVATLKSTEGTDPKTVERMMHGARAMRDSSSIYLSYAKFIAYGMPDSEEMVEDDLQA